MKTILIHGIGNTTPDFPVQWQAVTRLNHWPGGLGLYPAHVHVDFGPHRRWMGNY